MLQLILMYWAVSAVTDKALHFFEIKGILVQEAPPVYQALLNHWEKTL